MKKYVKCASKFGTEPNSLENQWDDLRELLSDTKILNEIFQMLSSDDIQNIIDTIKTNYDLDSDLGE